MTFAGVPAQTVLSGKDLHSKSHLASNLRKQLDVGWLLFYGIFTAVVFLDYLSHSLWASFITFSALPMA